MKVPASHCRDGIQHTPAFDERLEEGSACESDESPCSPRSADDGIPRSSEAYRRERHLFGDTGCSSGTDQQVFFRHDDIRYSPL